jgi:hypothetical protein
MSKKTYRFVDGEMVLVAVNGVPLYKESRDTSAAVFADLPGYESPIDGHWVEGRKARREDLKRSGSRPWEGLAAEKAHAARIQRENDKQLDELATRMAHRAWDQAPERIRRVFRGK